MDSGNSGSLHSSSGGDEEYDSRAAADSVSVFMSGGGGGPTSNPPPFFDPLANYLHQNSSYLNPSLAWPRPAIRSDPNSITHHHDNNTMLPASPPSTFLPSFHPTVASSGVVDNNTNPSLPPPPPQNHQIAAARNPKKRSRASRRAPTTVLTTDTTNFRAMVQEFTGIPSPPFTNPSFPRLDLFRTTSSSSTSAAAHTPPYLRRPFAQKPQTQTPHPFLASSNNIIPTQTSSNLFNNINPNPLLTSLLQSNSNSNSNPNPNPTLNPKFPFSNSPLITTTTEQQFGLPNLIPSEQINNNAAATWRNINNPMMNGDGDKDGHDRINLNAGSYNFNTTSSSSNVGSARGEGMVESWICSSE